LRSALELHDSRVSAIELAECTVAIYFSHAYIHKSKGSPGKDRGTGWSQEARLVLSEVESIEPLPALPNAIDEGYLEVGGIRHELIPLPFARKVGARLCLVFADATQLEIIGKKPFVELLGTAMYLEDVP
jgi:hypothetical protein